MNAFGGTMRMSESQSPGRLKAGLTQEGTADLRERRGKSPWESGLSLGLEEKSPWREITLESNKYEERIKSLETKSPSIKQLDVSFKGQTISRPFTETVNLEATRRSSAWETKPDPLGMLPRRMKLEDEYLPAACSGRIIQGPLGTVGESPQAPGSWRDSGDASPAGLGISVGKQPALAMGPRQGMGEPPCVAIKPGPGVTSPVEVDVGLPRPEEPNETKDTKPLMSSAIDSLEDEFAQRLGEKRNAENEPPDCIRPIYSGKFFDRSPCLPSAGKVPPIGYRVENCLTEELPRLNTPPEIKKFFNFRYPPTGAKRVFYGVANDPKVPPYLTHGIQTTTSIPAELLLNPQPLTAFQQKIKDKKESIYFSNQWAPLGKSRDPTPGLPKGLDIYNTTFGTALIRGCSAREVVNPQKSYEEVLEEGNKGHDLYIVSHNDYYGGEPKNRKYNPSSFHKFNTYGVPTPHVNDGRNMAKNLHWLYEQQMKKGAKVVSKRVDDFNEKFQHKLGRSLDPIAETMKVSPDHTFGACLRPEEYGVSDLIYNRRPGEYLRGKDRERAQIAAVRHCFKNFNYQNFDTMLAAFRHYDKNADGIIDKEELREACEKINLHLDEKVLDKLFEYCDVDNDGQISLLEFANYLTWKDKVPLKEYEERVVIKGRKPSCVNNLEVNAEESGPALLIKPEDVVLKEPGSSQKILRTLLRPSDKVSNHYKTTSSEIGAAVGVDPSFCYPTCGVPTIRSDIPVPRICSISSRTNYGEEGNVYSLLYPNIFGKKGIYERDFFKTRSKKEIADILCNIGVKLSDEEFENVWDLASKKHHRGEVCVETIRNVLDELQHAERTKHKTNK
ncbi:EF-hand domain-containing family member B [Sorex fumeus]|uniref:EF-hand domain-containing family member B n=1 Tax=Sorex fumeus TaxID=62283 RepID=UPI0024AE127A|nr:EF-hand domain-containing family member B [Sorex fumeus]